MFIKNELNQFNLKKTFISKLSILAQWDLFINYIRKTEYDVVLDVAGKSSYKACKNILKEKGANIATIVTFPVLFHMISTSMTKDKKVILSMPTEQTKTLKIIKA